MGYIRPKTTVKNGRLAISNGHLLIQDLIFHRISFGDGDVEALDGLPEGFDIPQMPEAPQEYSPGLDNELKQKAGV